MSHATRANVTLTRDLAFASGQDAGCANMRAAGRKAWNQEDADIAVGKTNRLLLYVPFERGGLGGLPLTALQLEDLGLTCADVERAGGTVAP